MKKKPLAIHTHIKETTLFRKRCITLMICVLGMVFILLIRLIYLQIQQNQFYSTLSKQNILNIMPIKPNRGLIYDRNGILLATNIPSYTLSIIPECVKNLKATFMQLKKIVSLQDNEIKQFNHLRYQYRPFQPIPLKFKLTEQEVARFYVNRYRFPGVLVQTRMMRYYPLNNITSDVIGYVGRINQRDFKNVKKGDYDASDDIGKMGIEKYYEKRLHGTRGSEEAEIDATGRTVRTLKRIPAKAGNNIYLTINSKLQEKAESVLGNESGAIVILKPSTGEILALVSNPSFNPNLFVSGISYNDYQKLINSSQHPLYNRAIRGQFALGSTLKPFYAIIALDNNSITTRYKIFDPGWFQLPNTEHIYHDWKRSGHGWVNVTRAIIVSCDTFFYNLAVNLGIKQIDNILNMFGFGRLSGIDMPEEVPGLVPTPQWKRSSKGNSWYTGDTIETVIGQGFMLGTPLQLAQATATIANRGKRYTPHLLLKTINQKGETNVCQPQEKKPITLKHPWVWETIIHAMQGVVDSHLGTAVYFGKHHPLYSIAAKTGTAQIYGHSRDEDRIRTNIPKRLRNNHLFIGFAPIRHPQIAIAVVVEHSAMADRKARKLFDYYFSHRPKVDTTQISKKNG